MDLFLSRLMGGQPEVLTDRGALEGPLKALSEHVTAQLCHKGHRPEDRERSPHSCLVCTGPDRPIWLRSEGRGALSDSRCGRRGAVCSCLPPPLGERQKCGNDDLMHSVIDVSEQMLLQTSLLWPAGGALTAQTQNPPKHNERSLPLGRSSAAAVCFGRSVPGPSAHLPSREKKEPLMEGSHFVDLLARPSEEARRQSRFTRGAAAASRSPFPDPWRGRGIPTQPLVSQTRADVTGPAVGGWLTRSSAVARAREAIFHVDRGIRTAGLSEDVTDKTNTGLPDSHSDGQPASRQRESRFWAMLERDRAD
ncbi:hypothetical protein P4O66_011658 [Electrophorus voltai]|uniref:Uncharacterized protein n=1 Tax=Electrophorus voltai TaxID=2609070 RepID=A0AAD8Z823_9TELE|nr:hypothetical protein P4O66_011658 [Electrophorus voltai]